MTRTRSNLAASLYLLGEHERARQEYEQIIEAWETTLGPGHPYLGMAANNLAIVYQALGRLDDAAALLGRALAVRTPVLGAEHRDVVGTRLNLATLLLALDRPDEAEALLREALDTMARVHGANHPEIGAIHTRLAVVLLGLDRPHEALEHGQNATRILAHVVAPDNLDAIEARYAVGASQLRLGLSLDAERTLTAVLDALRRSVGDRHPQVASVMGHLAESFWDQDKLDAAIIQWRETIALRRQLDGDDAPDTVVARARLSEVYLAAGRIEDARSEVARFPRLLTEALDDRTRAEAEDALARIATATKPAP